MSRSTWPSAVNPSEWKKSIAWEFRATGLALSWSTPSARAASTAVCTSERPIPWPRASNETTTGSISPCFPRMISPTKPITEPPRSATHFRAPANSPT